MDNQPAMFCVNGNCLAMAKHLASIHNDKCVIILSSFEPFSLYDKVLPQPEIRTFWCYDHEMKTEESKKASSHRESNPGLLA